MEKSIQIKKEQDVSQGLGDNFWSSFYLVLHEYFRQGYQRYQGY
jgi:hypothetical protein